jgi:hypothetical protein
MLTLADENEDWQGFDETLADGLADEDFDD